MMKGLSENPLVDILSGMFVEFEVLVDAKFWFVRVPSHSNVEDKPSGRLRPFE